MLTEHGKRENILTAYLNLLSHQGTRAATLEAVSSACNLSKAGVLHHFPNMQALRQGIFTELKAQASAEVEQMTADLPRAAEYYLVSSLSRDNLLERLIDAVYRLAQTGDADALGLLRSCRDDWYGALLLATGNEALAKLVLFAGDGLNHNALLSLDEANESFVGPATATQMLALVRQLQQTPTANA
ncbi:hypothetical protein GCM10009715_35070 [Paeniglutamicibacter psychrophenolicus]|uniref:AcrR family transcriptional regulator n=1 Tax=Paeniglutamicibacter psychrophenolicus TaxID=257454 RepID=A0ABS4WA71_9MICC|nr:TetR family transcriptional regulator [Paeniglutamicibacter psychrophenolicus]MBP2373095.1 AcrR family transcriptional regulator [Paeniglutamicibacter psychrophenolicus]